MLHLRRPLTMFCDDRHVAVIRSRRVKGNLHMEPESTRLTAQRTYREGLSTRSIQRDCTVTGCSGDFGPDANDLQLAVLQCNALLFKLLFVVKYVITKMEITPIITLLGIRQVASRF